MKITDDIGIDFDDLEISDSVMLEAALTAFNDKIAQCEVRRTMANTKIEVTASWDDDEGRLDLWVGDPGRALRDEVFSAAELKHFLEGVSFAYFSDKDSDKEGVEKAAPEDETDAAAFKAGAESSFIASMNFAK